MILDVAAHMGLEIVGSTTTACVMYGCKNAAHRHGRIVSVFAHSRAARLTLNGLLLLLFAYLTVRLLG